MRSILLPTFDCLLAVYDGSGSSKFILTEDPSARKTSHLFKPINGLTKFTTFHNFKFLLIRRYGGLIFYPCAQDIFPPPEKDLDAEKNEIFLKSSIA